MDCRDTCRDSTQDTRDTQDTPLLVFLCFFKIQPPVTFCVSKKVRKAMTTMHCLGASWCGLRGLGCKLWCMGECVALVLPCGLLVCYGTAAYTTSLAL